MTTITGSYHFRNLTPAAVWAALLDASLLPEALPYPVSRVHGLVYQRQGTVNFRAHVGPFPLREWSLALSFTDGVPVREYVVGFNVADVSGGHTLHGRGACQLTPHGRDTVLSYQFETQATGDFAAMGSLFVATTVRGSVRQTLQALEQWLQPLVTAVPTVLAPHNQ